MVEEGAVGAGNLASILESIPDSAQGPTELGLFKDFILSEQEVSVILSAFGLRTCGKAHLEQFG